MDRVDAAVDGLFEQDAVRCAGDADVVEALTLLGRLGRRVDAVAIEAVGAVAARSEGEDRDRRMTSRFGCHDVSELVQRTTRLGPQTVARLQKSSRAVRENVSLVSGAQLPAFVPAMREALINGEVGVDGLLAVAAPLAAMEGRVSRENLLTADAILAAEARGEGPDAAPPPCADLLRVQAQAWAVALDQDGAEPREDRSRFRRGVTLGTARDGVIPLRGNLLPEVAAQVQRIFDAMLSPRVDNEGVVRFVPEAPEGSYEALDQPPPVDDRRRAQRQHDALATALTVAAGSGELPTIGAAAPILVVSIREEDLATGRGWAHADGTEEPLSPAFARHVACTGSIQRITLDRAGHITRLGTEERVFNRYQRRAIALRDGGCIIPGCGVPAGWCEIHHVTEHAKGGPTHTDNGVLLCWFHHRFLDASGWRIRMNRGVPEVCAPLWNDAYQRWRPVTRSQTRLRGRVIQRT